MTFDKVREVEDSESEFEEAQAEFENDTEDENITTFEQEQEEGDTPESIPLPQKLFDPESMMAAVESEEAEKEKNPNRKLTGTKKKTKPMPSMVTLTRRKMVLAFENNDIKSLIWIASAGLPHLRNEPDYEELQKRMKDLKERVRETEKIENHLQSLNKKLTQQLGAYTTNDLREFENDRCTLTDKLIDLKYELTEYQEALFSMICVAFEGTRVGDQFTEGQILGILYPDLKKGLDNRAIMGGDRFR